MRDNYHLVRYANLLLGMLLLINFCRASHTVHIGSCRAMDGQSTNLPSIVDCQDFYVELGWHISSLHKAQDIFNHSMSTWQDERAMPKSLMTIQDSLIGQAAHCRHTFCHCRHTFCHVLWILYNIRCNEASLSCSHVD